MRFSMYSIVSGKLGSGGMSLTDAPPYALNTRKHFSLYSQLSWIHLCVSADFSIFAGGKFRTSDALSVDRVRLRIKSGVWHWILSSLDNQLVVDRALDGARGWVESRGNFPSGTGSPPIILTVWPTTHLSLSIRSLSFTLKFLTIEFATTLNAGVK